MSSGSGSIALSKSARIRWTSTLVKLHADRGWLRWVTLLGALLLLDASVTFQNVWPTPAVRWRGELSVELAVVALVIMLASRWRGPLSRSTVRWLGVLWVFLVVGRYVDVTTPALYGREVNLYWDLRFIPDVAVMLARAAPLWLVVAALATAALVFGLTYWLMRWGISQLGRAATTRREGLWVTVLD